MTLPAIPSGLNVADLITAVNDRLRRIAAASTTPAPASSPTNTTIVINQSTGKTGPVPVISAISAVDASTLGSSSPNYRPQWQDQAGALHTVVSVNVQGTNLQGGTVALWLFNPSTPGGIFMGVYGLTADSNQVFFGLPGSSTQNLLTPLSPAGWWVMGALGEAYPNEGPPNGSVTSGTFQTMAPPVGQALVLQPLPGAAAVQTVLSNQGLLVLVSGGGGLAELLMVMNSHGALEGQLLIGGPQNTSLRVAPEFALTASTGGSTLPPNPAGFVLAWWNGNPMKIPLYNA